MIERAYTVREIDDLRQAVTNKWLYGSYTGPRGRAATSRSYTESEKASVVEEIVRTHMMAGHTAADLYGSESVSDAV